VVTLDLDFGNPLRFRPSKYFGITVIRLSRRAGHPELLAAVETLAKALETDSIIGKLWIVEIGRTRIHQSIGEN
jgi:hypothetical protein